jgi:hypothetical protein
MEKAPLSLIIAALGILVAVPLQAGVHVTVAPEPVEKPVLFRAADDRYVTTFTGGLFAWGTKIGSKQIFTIIDLNGGDLADGDSVKIRYTPHSGGVADQSKSSYWSETAEGIKRSSGGGSVFKIKLVDTKYTFQAPSGKFVSGVLTANMFGLSDKPADALLLELVDVSSGIPKKPKKPQAEAPAAPAPEKPAAPAAEKPAAE